MGKPKGQKVGFEQLSLLKPREKTTNISTCSSGCRVNAMGNRALHGIERTCTLLAVDWTVEEKKKSEQPWLYIDVV